MSLSNLADQGQSGIIAPTRAHAQLITLQVTDLQRATAIAAVCGDIPKRTAELAAVFNEPALSAVVSFGAALHAALFPGAQPAQLKPLAALSAPTLSMPASGGDIFLHLSADRADAVYALGEQILTALSDLAQVQEAIPTFRYLDSRDLTGFEDGTANPKGAERAEVAYIDQLEPAFRGGSYVLVQRYVHRLQAWQQLSVADQEQVIGRTKADSKELPESDKPISAHISRVEIEENEEELRILRHSMPYGVLGGEQGLMFLAYAKEARIFEQMLQRMLGHADGIMDSLLRYTTPRSGALFFAPPQQALLNKQP